MVDDFDQIADELYALPAADFTAKRDERSKAAKDAGDADLAKQVKQLRKPSKSAAAINQLVRERPGLLDEVRELAAGFREEGLSAVRIKELTAARQELLRDAVRGVRDAELQRDIEATFTAALSDAESADELATARLVKPLSYSGFGPGLSFAPPPERAEADVEAGEEDAEEAAKRRAAERAEELKQAKDELQAAEAELERRQADLRAAEARFERAKNAVALLTDQGPDQLAGLPSKPRYLTRTDRPRPLHLRG